MLVTNPTQSDVRLDPDDVVSALFGQVGLVVDREAGGRMQAVFSEDGAVLTHGADGVLITCLPYLSAAVALYTQLRLPGRLGSRGDGALAADRSEPSPQPGPVQANCSDVSTAAEV